MTTSQTGSGSARPVQAPVNSELTEKVRLALRSQKQKTVTVLSSLLAVQDAFHYIPREAIEETAAFCNSTSNEVWSVASFYTNFRFTPPGRHTIDVCWGPSCHIMGAQAVLKAVQDRLDLHVEGDSPDGSITLRYNTCLGACAQAPCVAVDHHVTGRVTPETAAEIAGQAASRSGH
jgi:NADH:ubiquinone oxidoreductase subunit E